MEAGIITLKYHMSEELCVYKQLRQKKDAVQEIT
jgi:hypothetical protein